MEDDNTILNRYKIQNIDLIIVNLYDFKNAINNLKDDEIIENIDIGGPTLIRASAKNYKFKTIITDPEDYDELLEQLVKKKSTTLDFRLFLRKKHSE